MTEGMPTTTDAELSLINDAEFLEQLEQFDDPQRQLSDPVDAPARPGFAFDALDQDLPMDADAPHPGVPLYDREPVANPYDDPDEARSDSSAPDRARIPLVAAALVLAACLTAGAATAAFVFHDRLTAITATPASR